MRYIGEDFDFCGRDTIRNKAVSLTKGFGNNGRRGLGTLLHKGNILKRGSLHRQTLNFIMRLLSGWKDVLKNKPVLKPYYKSEAICLRLILWYTKTFKGIFEGRVFKTSIEVELKKKTYFWA